MPELVPRLRRRLADKAADLFAPLALIAGVPLLAFALLEDGGGGGEGDGGEGGDGQGGGDGDRGASSSSSGEDEGEGDGEGDEDALPAWARRQLAKARNEAARYRNNLRGVEEKQGKTEGQLKAIAKALGLTEDGEPDPDEISRERAALQAENRKLKVDGALAALASKHNAKLTLTRALLRDEGTLDQLDPSSDTFTADLEKAVTTAIKANPELKATQAAGKSGSEFNGNGGGGKPATLEEAVNARLSS